VGQKNHFIYLTHALLDGLFESIPILLSFILLESVSPEKDIGIVISIGMTLSTFFGLVATSVSRRVSAGSVFACSLMTYGVTFLIAAFSSGTLTVKICFALAISVTSFFHITAFSYLMFKTDIHERGKVMSNFTAIGDIGRIPFASCAAFIAALTVFNRPGWSLFCLIFGTIAAALALCQFFNLHKVKEPQIRTSEPRQQRKILPSFALLKNRASRLAILACILDSLCNARLFTFFPLLLISKGVDASDIVYFTFLYTFGSLAGKIVFGRLSDHVSSAKMFMGCELVMAGAIAVLILTISPVILFVLAMLLGAVSRGTVPVAQILIADTVKPENFGDIISIRDFATGLVGIITPAFYGYMAVRFGISTIYALMACGAFAASIPVFLSIRINRIS